MATRIRAWRPTEPDCVVSKAEVVNGKLVLTISRHTTVTVGLPVAYGTASEPNLDHDCGGVLWREEVERNPVWIDSWNPMGAAVNQFHDTSDDNEKDRHLREFLRNFHAAQELLKWAWEKNPGRSSVLKPVPPGATFWDYRAKFMEGPWCAAMQWIRNLQEHADANARYWEPGPRFPIWKCSADLPAGDPKKAKSNHSKAAKLFFDQTIRPDDVNKAIPVQQTLSMMPGFISNAAQDLGLPLQADQIWPKDGCPYDQKYLLDPAWVWWSRPRP